jgi:glycosyltransferase involved in cell wall biosynthesis
VIEPRQKTLTRPLHVAILGKSNRHGGGASKCSELLAEGLISLGHETDRFTVHRPVEDPGGRVVLGKIGAGLARRGHAIARRLLGGEFLPIELPAVRSWPRRYDVVHINDHWQAVSPWTMAWLARRVPTVLTLHDASYFTGGCLYPHECGRFADGCGACPQRQTMGMPVDMTRASWWLKRWILASAPLHLTAPSRWMARLAASSHWVSQLPEVITNCARAAFRPGAREAGRARLGLDPTDRAVLIGASSLTDPRKGAMLAVDAINRAADHHTITILLGKNPETVRAALHSRVVVAGYIDDDNRLAEVYAAADAFLFPSLTDNAPLSVIESLLCGTPVICFARGGTPELISSGDDGDVVPDITAEALAAALTRRLRRQDGASVRDHVARAASRFSLDRYGRDHVALYRRLLDARHRQL